MNEGEESFLNDQDKDRFDDLSKVQDQISKLMQSPEALNKEELLRRK